jgi:tRNA threonylcarbamoyl adenosine modification protein YeaZ
VPKLLALDTSTKFGAIALAEWESGKTAVQSMRVIAELALGVDSTQQSESVLLGIDQLLKHARVQLEDLDYLACGVGPGSFTGVRVGLMTLKTLGYVTKKPVARFSSLALLARPVVSLMALPVTKRAGTDVVVLRPAAAGEWYVLVGESERIADCIAKSQGDYPGSWASGVREELMTPDKLYSFLKKRKAKKRLWIASQFGQSDWNAKRLLEIKKELGLKSCLSVEIGLENLPQPRWAARLAVEAVEAGLVLNANQILPRYLREADATRKLNRGELKVRNRFMPKETN